MTKSLKPKKSKSLSTDSEERIQFGPYNLWMTRKEISNVYKRRRGPVVKGNCSWCGYDLQKNGIGKDFKCTKCNIDLAEHCFEDFLKNREKEIENVLGKFKRG